MYKIEIKSVGIGDNNCKTDARFIKLLRKQIDKLVLAKYITSGDVVDFGAIPESRMLTGRVYMEGGTYRDFYGNLAANASAQNTLSLSRELLRSLMFLNKDALLSDFKSDFTGNYHGNAIPKTDWGLEGGYIYWLSDKNIFVAFTIRFDLVLHFKRIKVMNDILWALDTVEVGIHKLKLTRGGMDAVFRQAYPAVRNAILKGYM